MNKGTRRVLIICLLVFIIMIGVGLYLTHRGDLNTQESTEQTLVDDTSDVEEDADVSIPEYATSTTLYDSSSDYFSGSFQSVEITDNNHDVLKKAVAKKFNELLNGFNSNADYYSEQAEADSALVSSDDEDYYAPEYFYNETVEVVRCDNQIFSVKLTIDSFEGGAHGSETQEGIVFDTQTGEILDISDLGDISDDALAYICSIVDESPEEYTAGLYDGYQDIISQALTGDSNEYGMWLDNRGLVICFEQYSIAPYAAGIPTFTIPYSELSGFKADYIPEDGFYIAALVNNGLVEKVDVDGDGEYETIEIAGEYDYDSGKSDFSLTLGENTVSIKNDSLYGITGYYVHSTNGDYVFVDGYEDNGWEHLYMYSADGLKLITDDEYGIASIRDGVITLTTIKDVLGTWEVSTDYKYDSDGLTAESTTQKIDNNPSNNSNAVGLTLAQDLEFSSSSSSFDSTQTLNKGTVIYPTLLIYNDNQTVMGFVADDGTLGYFVYEITDGTVYVNGIDENDLFESVPYAG